MVQGQTKKHKILQRGENKIRTTEKKTKTHENWMGRLDRAKKNRLNH